MKKQTKLDSKQKKEQEESKDSTNDLEFSGAQEKSVCLKDMNEKNLGKEFVYTESGHQSVLDCRATASTIDSY